MESTLANKCSFKIPWGSYRLNSLVSNSNSTMYLDSTYSYFKLLISYNLIHKGRASHGTFFFLCSPVDNLTKRWYENSCMTSFSAAHLGRTCKGFSPPNNLMKVALGEEYQYAMFIITSIYSQDMKVGSYSNIRLYNGMIKWSVNLAITPW